MNNELRERLNLVLSYLIAVFIAGIVILMAWVTVKMMMNGV